MDPLLHSDLLRLRRLVGVGDVLHDSFIFICLLGGLLLRRFIRRNDFLPFRPEVDRECRCK